MNKPQVQHYTLTCPSSICGHQLWFIPAYGPHVNHIKCGKCGEKLTHKINKGGVAHLEFGHNGKQTYIRRKHVLETYSRSN